MKTDPITETNSNGFGDENDGDDGSDLTMTSCQSTAANNVYDLRIHNQARLWKALPKPPNTSQVGFHHLRYQGSYCVIAMCCLFVTFYVRICTITKKSCKWYFASSKPWNIGLSRVPWHEVVEYVLLYHFRMF